MGTVKDRSSCSPLKCNCWLRPAGSGKAAGELSTGQEARSHPTAAAGQTFLSEAPPCAGSQTGGEQGALGAGKDSAPTLFPFFLCLPGGKRSTRCGCSCKSE